MCQSVLSLSTILCAECELLYILTDRTIELWEISDSGDKVWLGLLKSPLASC